MRKSTLARKSTMASSTMSSACWSASATRQERKRDGKESERRRTNGRPATASHHELIPSFLSPSLTHTHTFTHDNKHAHHEHMRRRTRRGRAARGGLERQEGKVAERAVVTDKLRVVGRHDGDEQTEARKSNARAAAAASKQPNESAAAFFLSLSLFFRGGEGKTKREGRKG